LILSFGLLFLFAVMYDDYQSLFGEYLSEVFRPANCHCPRTTDPDHLELTPSSSKPENKPECMTQ